MHVDAPDPEEGSTDLQVATRGVPHLKRMNTRRIVFRVTSCVGVLTAALLLAVSIDPPDGPLVNDSPYTGSGLSLREAEAVGGGGAGSTGLQGARSGESIIRVRLVGLPKAEVVPTVRFTVVVLQSVSAGVLDLTGSSRVESVFERYSDPEGLVECSVPARSVVIICPGLPPSLNGDASLAFEPGRILAPPRPVGACQEYLVRLIRLPGESFTVRVIDDATSAPIAGALVAQAGPRTDSASVGDVLALLHDEGVVTDVAGTCRGLDKWRGARRVFGVATGYSISCGSLSASRTEELVIRLTRAREIEFRWDQRTDTSRHLLLQVLPARAPTLGTSELCGVYLKTKVTTSNHVLYANAPRNVPLHYCCSDDTGNIVYWGEIVAGDAVERLVILVD